MRRTTVQRLKVQQFDDRVLIGLERLKWRAALVEPLNNKFAASTAR
jgi:hypothetical protein